MLISIVVCIHIYIYIYVYIVVSILHYVYTYMHDIVDQQQTFVSSSENTRRWSVSIIFHWRLSLISLHRNDQTVFRELTFFVLWQLAVGCLQKLIDTNAAVVCKLYQTACLLKSVPQIFRLINLNETQNNVLWTGGLAPIRAQEDLSGMSLVWIGTAESQNSSEKSIKYFGEISAKMRSIPQLFVRHQPVVSQKWLQHMVKSW